MAVKVLVCRLFQGLFILLIANSIALAILKPSAAMVGLAALALIFGSFAIAGLQSLIVVEAFWKNQLGDSADEFLRNQPKRGKRS